MMQPGAVIFLEGREPRHPGRGQGPKKINGDQEAVNRPTLETTETCKDNARRRQDAQDDKGP